MKKSEILRTILSSLEGLSYQEITTVLAQVESIAKNSKISKLNESETNRLLDLYLGEEVREANL